jgi:hypothetical protein
MNKKRQFTRVYENTEFEYPEFFSFRTKAHQELDCVKIVRKKAQMIHDHHKITYMVKGNSSTFIVTYHINRHEDYTFIDSKYLDTDDIASIIAYHCQLIKKKETKNAAK